MLKSLIWDLRGPQRLLCSPKNGRKLLLGKKHTVVGFRASQEAPCLIREFQDLSNSALFPVCLKNDFFFLHGNSDFISFKNQYFLLNAIFIATWKTRFFCFKVSGRINEGRANYWETCISLSILQIWHFLLLVITLLAQYFTHYSVFLT